MAKQRDSGPAKPVANAGRGTADGGLSEADVEDSGPTSRAHGREEEARMGACGGDDHETLYFDMLSKVYVGIQEQIRFADMKAGFVAAFNAILIGFIATNLDAIKDIYRTTHDWNVCLWLMALSLLMGIPTAVSIVFLILAVRPRLGKNTHRSRIYFGHIARDYHLDAVRYRNDAHAMKQGDWADDYGYQIVEVAKIAHEKHSNINISIIFSIAAFVSLVIISLFIHITSVVHNAGADRQANPNEAHSRPSIHVRLMAPAEFSSPRRLTLCCNPPSIVLMIDTRPPDAVAQARPGTPA